MQTMVGTPYFLAPEIVSGDEEKGYTAKVDVWAVGITAIQCAEGQPPYHDVNPMRALFLISQKAPPKLKDAKKWSTGLNELVEALLRKDDTARASCADALSMDVMKDSGKQRTRWAQLKFNHCRCSVTDRFA